MLTMHLLTIAGMISPPRASAASSKGLILTATSESKSLKRVFCSADADLA